VEQQLVQRVKGIKVELGRILTEIDPQNDPEWEAHDKITAAHRQLRNIEYSKLGQLMLPETNPPEIECPTCKGRGDIGDSIGDGFQSVFCPQCKGRGKVAADGKNLEQTDSESDESWDAQCAEAEANSDKPEKPARKRKPKTKV